MLLRDPSAYNTFGNTDRETSKSNRKALLKISETPVAAPPFDLLRDIESRHRSRLGTLWPAR
jgi:hypothetical protein